MACSDSAPAWPDSSSWAAISLCACWLCSRLFSHTAISAVRAAAASSRLFTWERASSAFTDASCIFWYRAAISASTPAISPSSSLRRDCSTRILSSSARMRARALRRLSIHREISSVFFSPAKTRNSLALSALLPQGFHPSFQLPQNVPQPVQVLPGGGQAALRLGAAEPEFGDSGSFLKNFPPVAVLGGDDLCDLPLADDRVTVPPGRCPETARRRPAAGPERCQCGIRSPRSGRACGTR